VVAGLAVGRVSVGDGRRTAGRPHRRSVAGGPTGRVLELQRLAGNRAVCGLLVQRETATVEKPASQPARAEPLYRKGEKHFKAGQFALAADYFTKAYELFPLPEIAFSLAQALRRSGGHAMSAVEHFRIYLGAKPDGGRAADAREAIDELLGPRPSGDADADRGLAERPFRLGEKAFKRGDFLLAADLFSQAYALLSMPEIAFSWAMALYRGQGPSQQAVELFKVYVQQQPGGSRVKHALAIIAELSTPEPTGDPKQDRDAAYETSVRADKAYAAGKYGQAYDLWTAAYGLKALPQLLFNRAQALRHLGGRNEVALSLYSQYVAADPSGSRVDDAREAMRLMREEGAAAD
jgi:tetratricopeptide (TPR) repeat protein